MSNHQAVPMLGIDASEARESDGVPELPGAWPDDAALVEPPLVALPVAAIGDVDPGDRTLRTLVRSRVRRDLLARELGSQLRHVFVLMGEYMAQCQPGVDAQRLLEPLDDVIRGARASFQLTARLHTDNPRDAAEKLRCLDELDALRAELAEGGLPPQHDLKHALDALIVQFVRIDTQRHAGPALSTGSQLADRRPS